MKINFKYILSAIGILAAIALTIILGIYYYYFHHLDISNDQAIWGQFGDYVGGIANPLFGFLTTMALVISLYLQNKQLNVTTKELEETRKELKRSSDIQIESELALRNQAKALKQTFSLEAIILLIDIYSKEIDSPTKTNQIYGSLGENEIMDRLDFLKKTLDVMYDKITAELHHIIKYD